MEVLQIALAIKCLIIIVTILIVIAVFAIAYNTQNTARELVKMREDLNRLEKEVIKNSCKGNQQTSQNNYMPNADYNDR